MRSNSLGLSFAFAIPTLLGGCGDQGLDSQTVSQGAALSASARGQFERGSSLFFHQTFQGNGRTCSTCHILKSDEDGTQHDNFDFTPADAQQIFAQDPDSPLFRPIDSDDGAGANYSTLLNHALVHIPLPVPSNITIDERDSLVHTDPNTGALIATVLRSTPTIENAVFQDELMWDGRMGSDLPGQALAAVKTHDQPGRLPTASETQDLAAFQDQFFSTGALLRYKLGGPAPQPPTVPDYLTGPAWDSVRRGRAFFVDDGQAAVDATHRDLCATCHSGPMLNTTSNSNPVQPAGQRFAGNFVSETNDTLGIHLPEHTYHVLVTHDVLMPPGTVFPIPPGAPLFPAGTVFTLHSSDPGRFLISGDPCELPLACLINSNPALGVFGTASTFRIPTLWGVADTAPYFHNNAAATLTDVMKVYAVLFGATADGLNALGLNGEPFRLSQQDTDDIISYINFGFHRTQPD